MYEYIRGTLSDIYESNIVVEAAGVGYKLVVTNPFRYASLEQQEVKVFTYHYVREDQMTLYGFTDIYERLLFERLLQVSGIGPKAAISMLSSSPQSIVEAIHTDNIPVLTEVPGIGKKTAQRLIIELKDKLDDLILHYRTDDVTPVKRPKSGVSLQAETEALQEAMDALKSLGYADKELQQITPVLKEQALEDWEVEQFVKLGLKLLMKG
jgi:Holliday junction DNA helicase RuvA